MPSLAQIEAYLASIATQLASYFASLQLIYTQALYAAKEHSPYQVFNLVNGSHTLITDPTYGLEAIQADIVALQTSVTALGTPQQTGDPVTLPATTPDGPWFSDSNIAGDVWGASMADYGEGTYSDAVMRQNQWLASQGHVRQIRLVSAPLFYVGDYYPTIDSDLPNDYPDAIISTILSTDTPVSWLSREDPSHVWNVGFPNGDYVSAPTTGGGTGTWVLDIGPAAWKELLSVLFGTSASVEAPIWPGLTGVTLGAPVSLDVTVTIALPMDGCLVSITAVPSKTGFYTFGGVVSYRNIGAISFVSDDGSNEFPQGLGFASALYCPKVMAHASGVVVRCAPGVTGTITPFTIV